MSASDKLRILKTRTAVAGARAQGLLAEDLAKAAKLPAKEFDALSRRGLSDAQLRAIARRAKRSIPELMILGDPDGGQLNQTRQELAETLDVFSGLRKTQEQVANQVKSESPRRQKNPSAA